MTLFSRIKNMFSGKTLNARTHCLSGQAFRARLSLEYLENRVLPARTLLFVGAMSATGSNWGNAANWQVNNENTKMAPQTGDTLQFTGATKFMSTDNMPDLGAVTIVLSPNLVPELGITLNSPLTVAGNSSMAAGTITGDKNFTIESGATFAWSGGTIGGSGQLVVSDNAHLIINGTNTNPLVLDWRDLVIQAPKNLPPAAPPVTMQFAAYVSQFQLQFLNGIRNRSLP